MTYSQVKALRPIEQHYWESYWNSLAPEKRPEDACVEASHAGNRSITDGLLALYLSGKKSAGSSVVEDFIAAGDLLPQVGNHWILLDSSDKPRCILRTARLAFHKFNDVPIEIAIAEGEGDLSLDEWRTIHAELYTPHLSNWGLAVIDDATIVTEFFELVYSL